MKVIIDILTERYIRLSLNTSSYSRVCSMMWAIQDNLGKWPSDKVGRWLGYVQCLLIEVEDTTTIKKERDFTRPLFHQYYKELGLDIPDSVEI